MEKLSAALLGSTGMAGHVFMPFLADHPYFDLKVLSASERSAGNPYNEVAKWYLETPIPSQFADVRVITIEDTLKTDVDIVFCALPYGIAEGWEPKFAEKGMTVFSDA